MRIPGLIFLSFITLASCKSKTAVLSTFENPEQILLDKINEASLEYHWFSSKAKIRLESNEKSGGGRMNIRMVRDSLIWFNFKKLSIEGARGLITQDSFKIIYRTEKKYEIGNIQSLMAAYDLPLSFRELQFYISGNIPVPSDKSLTYKKTSTAHLLYGSNDSYKLLYSFDDDLNLSAFSLTDVQNRKLRIELDNKDEELGIYLSRKLFFPYGSEGLGILYIDLSNIEINVPKNTPFSIPDHYTEY